MKLVINNLHLSPDKEINYLKKIVLDKYQIPIQTFTLLRKSLDARKKNKIFYNCKILINLDSKKAKELLLEKDVSEYTPPSNYPLPNIKKKISPLIIGTGPAGLFCALRLSEAGLKTKLFEQGKIIEERQQDVDLLKKNGLLNEESNVLFGEGGAGTFSDGKIYSRVKNSKEEWLFKQFVKFGAPLEILYEAKPHLGTDRLKKIIKNIRTHLKNKGTEFYFQEKVTDLLLDQQKILGIKTSQNKEYQSSLIILATGHSARDIYQLLKDKNIVLEKKGFAVGIRVEHPKNFIDKSQYGSSPFKKILPPAEYFLNHKNKKTNRSTYSFCMCPGGEIINASSENNLLNTNGMSFSKRDSFFSNAAIVVTVSPLDLGNDPLAGIDFQKKLEGKAFKAGKGNFKAPVQTVNSFLKEKIDSTLPKISFKPGGWPADYNSFLPTWLAEELKAGFLSFEKKIKNFSFGPGVLVGLETRTSSPVRILRNDSFQAINLPGLFPIGEGAGYSGGIISSALDGLRAADYIINSN